MKSSSTKVCTFQAPKLCHGQSDHTPGLLAIESLKDSDLSCTQMMGWFPNGVWIWPRPEDLSQPAPLGLWKLNTGVMFFRSRSSSSKFVGFLSNLWLAGYAKIVTNYIYTPGFEGAAVVGALRSSIWYAYMYLSTGCSWKVSQWWVPARTLITLFPPPHWA
jgi:hypothetical protein